MSRTSVASSQVIPVATIAAPHSRGQRLAVVARAAGAECSEEDGQQENDLDALAEEDREREEEGEQRRGDALRGERAVDVAQACVDRGRVAAQLAQRRAVPDAVAQLGEAELEVEHEVRVAQPERHLGELEVVEVGRAREVVRALPIARACSGDGLVDERVRARDLRAGGGELVVARRPPGRQARRRRRATPEGGEPASLLQRRHGAVEVAVDVLRGRLDLGRRLARLDVVAELVESASSISSMRSWSRSPSGSSTSSKCSRYASPTACSAAAGRPER